MKILLVVGTANDIFIYNMAKWLKKEIKDISIDVFELYHSNQQDLDLGYYDNIDGVKNNWCTNIRGLRRITASFREAHELDRYLKDKHYDIIQCHWIRPAMVLAKNLRSHCDRLYVTFWGREYVFFNVLLSKSLYRQKLGRLLKSADCILNSKGLYDRLLPIYPHIKNKYYPIKLGAASLDYLYEILNKDSKEIHKEKWEIPIDKFSVLIGYSGKSLHQHLKVIEFFVKNPCFKDKIHLLAIMTRGVGEAYLKQVEDALNNSGYTYTIIKGRFLSDEEIASLRYATDITMQLSTTDGFSRSIVECLSARSVMIYGKWLNYDDYFMNDGYNAISAKTFEDAFEKLVYVVDNFEQYFAMTESNSDSGRANTWEACIKNWVYAYTNKISFLQKKMKNISQLKDCYGCGVCSASCPKKIISIVLNKDGFYEPHIMEPDRCLNCGICLDVCAFNHKELALDSKEKQIKSWAAWSNDTDVRQKCSSGGIGFEIGKQLIEQGYHAVGCRYDIKEQRAEHYIATTVEEFVQSIGSKYIQSYTEDAFKQIKRKGQKYLITGTPCQIDSFRRMIRKFRCEDNFILMDFYCHCVPSMWAWTAYIKMIESKIGKVTYASWRNKFTYGWHDSWLMGVDGENTSKPVDWHDSYNLLIREKKTFVQSRMSQGDLFYKLFLGDICLGSQCEKNCKYKYDCSSADIRIGDLWGETYKDDEKGVSALVSFTDKGRGVVESLQGITLVEHPFEVVAEGQMKKNAKHKETTIIIKYLLRKEFSLTSLLFKITIIIQRVINKLRRITKL